MTGNRLSAFTSGSLPSRYAAPFRRSIAPWCWVPAPAEPTGVPKRGDLVSGEAV